MNKLFPLSGDVLLLIKQIIQENCCGPLLRFQRTGKKQHYEAVCREMNWKLFFTQNPQRENEIPFSLENEDIMIALLDTGNPKLLQLLFFTCTEWIDFQAGHIISTGPLDFPFPGQAAFAPYIHATTMEFMDFNNAGYPRTLSEGERTLFKIKENILVVHEQIADLDDDWSPKSWELIFFENMEQAEFLIDRYGYKLDLIQKKATVMTEYQWQNHFLSSVKYKENRGDVYELAWSEVGMEIQTEQFSSMHRLGKRAIEIMKFFETTSFAKDIAENIFTFKIEMYKENIYTKALPEEPE